MAIREIIDSFGDHIVETYDQEYITRPPDLVEKERQLNPGLRSWASEHNVRYPKMGTLPNRSDLFPDMLINRPHRPINSIARVIAKAERSEKRISKIAKPAIYLARSAYFDQLKNMHARAVGSKAVSDTMVLGFLETPAEGQAYHSPSLAEYTVECLEESEDMTIGLTSVHLKDLADIAEFATALNISIAETHGFKYIDRFTTLMNKNKAWQSYRVGIVPIPLSWLLRSSTGLLYGGPPGESADKHGVSGEPLAELNLQMSRTFLKLKKEQSIVMAYVPTNSGAVRVNNEESGQLEKVLLKDASYTSPITVRCGGGIIVANKEGDDIALSSVIKNDKPSNISKKEYEKLLTDEIMREHANQAHELTGVPVEFMRLSKLDMQPH